MLGYIEATLFRSPLTTDEQFVCLFMRDVTAIKKQYKHGFDFALVHSCLFFTGGSEVADFSY